MAVAACACLVFASQFLLTRLAQPGPPVLQLPKMPVVFVGLDDQVATLLEHVLRAWHADRAPDAPSPARLLSRDWRLLDSHGAPNYNAVQACNAANASAELLSFLRSHQAVLGLPWAEHVACLHHALHAAPSIFITSHIDSGRLFADTVVRQWRREKTIRTPDQHRDSWLATPLPVRLRLTWLGRLQQRGGGASEHAMHEAALAFYREHASMRARVLRLQQGRLVALDSWPLAQETRARLCHAIEAAWGPVPRGTPSCLARLHSAFEPAEPTALSPLAWFALQREPSWPMLGGPDNNDDNRIVLQRCKLAYAPSRIAPTQSRRYMRPLTCGAGRLRSSSVQDVAPARHAYALVSVLAASAGYIDSFAQLSADPNATVAFIKRQGRSVGMEHEMLALLVSLCAAAPTNIDFVVLAGIAEPAREAHAVIELQRRFVSILQAFLAWLVTDKSVHVRVLPVDVPCNPCVWSLALQAFGSKLHSVALQEYDAVAFVDLDTMLTSAAKLSAALSLAAGSRALFATTGAEAPINDGRFILRPNCSLYFDLEDALHADGQPDPVTGWLSYGWPGGARGIPNAGEATQGLLSWRFVQVDSLRASLPGMGVVHFAGNRHIWSLSARASLKAGQIVHRADGQSDLAPLTDDEKRATAKLERNFQSEKYCHAYWILTRMAAAQASPANMIAAALVSLDLVPRAVVDLLVNFCGLDPAA